MQLVFNCCSSLPRRLFSAHNSLTLSSASPEFNFPPNSQIPILPKVNYMSTLSFDRHPAVRRFWFETLAYWMLRCVDKACQVGGRDVKMMALVGGARGHYL